MRKLLILLLIALLSNLIVRVAKASEPEGVCEMTVARIERETGIAQGLLQAIADVESGRYDHVTGENIAWPWTVMAEGEGRFLNGKGAAIAEVRGLQAKGVKNIDVGCMQVNLMWHPDAFSSLDEAFDPESNVRYAARFLKRLFEREGDWFRAAKAYHSTEPHKAIPYGKKIRAAWNAIRSGGSLRLADADDTLPMSARFSAHKSEPLTGEARQANAWRQKKLAEYRARMRRLARLKNGRQDS